MPEDQLEPALRQLVAQSGAAAGALCLLDPRVGRLRLAAEVGLSDEGCRRLRTLGRPGGERWPVPLESLRARLPRVIASSTTVPIPPLIEPSGVATTVACLPLLGDELPLGTVILVARVPASFPAERLEALRPALAALARTADDVLRRIRPAAPIAPGSTLFRIAGGAIEAIGPALDTAARLLHSAAVLRSGACDDARHAREEALARAELSAAIDALADERDRLLDQRAAAEESHAAEIAHWAARLDEAEATWSRNARARETRVREEVDQRLQALAERSAADREENLRRAHDLSERAEELRAAAAADATAARAELAEARAAAVTLEASLARTAERAQRLEAASQATAAERARLERGLAEALESLGAAETRTTALRTSTAVLEAELATRDRELATRTAELERDAETRLATLREQIDALARERDRIGVERDTARADAQRSRDELQAFASHSASAREATLRAALDANEATEAARAAACTELEATRTALAQAQALILGLEDADARRALADTEREAELRGAAAPSALETARAALADSEASRLAAEDDVRALRAELARLAPAESDRERLVAEASVAVAQARDAEARAEALARDLAGARDITGRLDAAAHTQARQAARLQARLGEAEAGLTRERAHTTTLEASHARLAAELEEARSLVRQRTEELRATEQSGAEHEQALRRAIGISQEAEEARASAVEEVEALREAFARAQQMILAVEDQAQGAREEAERVGITARQATEERQYLITAVDEAMDRVAMLGARVAELEGAIVAERAAQAREHRQAGFVTAAPQPVEPAPLSAAAGARLIAVIDDSQGWQHTAAGLAAIAPRDVTPERIAELGAGCVLVNLAAAGAIAAVERFRNAGVTSPLWGCLGSTSRDTVLGVGPIEILEPPLDPDHVLDRLGPYLPQRRRVLAVGADGPAILALRQALARVGLAVSIAWDTKQAVDLLELMRPEIVIVDLGLPPRGGHPLVTALAGALDEPLVVLLPSGEDDERTFAQVAGPVLAGPRAMPREQLITRLLS
jgi:CheY-like chemotaxis protein